MAAYNKQSEVALLLIRNFSCDPTLIGYLGESLLHNACRGGSTSLVQTLTREYKADINARNDQNDSIRSESNRFQHPQTDVAWVREDLDSDSDGRLDQPKPMG